MLDIRTILFETLLDKRYLCQLTAEMDGWISGMVETLKQADQIGLKIKFAKEDGEFVNKNDVILSFAGTAVQVSQAEEQLMGYLGKASGVATAAKHAVDQVGNKVKIVCGAIKKMPSSLKESLRNAVLQSGCLVRIAPHPMIYIDKNTVRMHGGIAQALSAVASLNDHTKCIQLRKYGLASIADETEIAVAAGADILMIDTGVVSDLEECINYLEGNVLRDKVKVAYAGQITLKDLPSLAKVGVDYLDIGRAILDAPLMDMSLDVITQTDV